MYECNDCLIDYYKPKFKGLNTDKIKHIAENLKSTEDAQVFLSHLISKINVYYLEHLSWKLNIKVLIFIRVFIGAFNDR